MRPMSDFIERARALDKAATEGPWEVDCADDDYSTYADGTLMRSVASKGRAITWDDHGGEVFKSEDAEFIATARTEWPRMAAALRRVADLHQQETGGTPSGDVADVCSCGVSYYPCATLRAIEGDEW